MVDCNPSFENVIQNIFKIFEVSINFPHNVVQLTYFWAEVNISSIRIPLVSQIDSDVYQIT